MKKFGIIVLIALKLCLLASCGNGSPAPGAAETEQAGAVTIIDREGKEISVPEKVEKIISISPAATETLIDLGLSEKLVAVDQYSALLPGLPEGLPAYDIMAPDTESIAALRPDIVFATGMSKADGDDPFKPVTDLGVLMTYIPASESIADIKADIRFIGGITGTEAQAEGLIADLEQEISGILDIIAAAGDLPEYSVYFELDSMPRLYSLGAGNFIHEMIEMLGARNVLEDQTGWLSISEEAVIAANPDIIFTSVYYVDDPVGDIMGRPGWQAVSAVKNGRVYQVNGDAIGRPNENIGISFDEMARALYPELF